MGRPKGSLNKKKKLPVKKYRKRGRPKGKKKVNVPAIVYDMSKVKITKFLGYCPKCKFMISKKELVSKLVFLCPACNKKDRVTKLLKETGSEKPKSKKEYLQSTVHVSSLESLPLNDVQLGGGDLKIQE